MLFTVTFKTPDARPNEDIPDELQDDVYECMRRNLKWGEYITVEFDTDNPKYSKVIPQR